MVTIGVLHGCRQDKGTMQSLMRNYSKRLKVLGVDAKWVFMEGQYNYINDQGEVQGKMWYKDPLILEDIGTVNMSAETIEDTVNYIDTVVKEHCIDVLIGFSQGGNAVSTYLKTIGGEGVRCAIIMAGYDYPMFANTVSNTPLLYITSDSDTIVPPEHLIAGNRTTDILHHDQGHKICQSRAHCTAVMGWLRDMVARYTMRAATRPDTQN